MATHKQASIHTYMQIAVPLVLGLAHARPNYTNFLQGISLEVIWKRMNRVFIYMYIVEEEIFSFFFNKTHVVDTTRKFWSQKAMVFSCVQNVLQVFLIIQMFANKELKLFTLNPSSSIDCSYSSQCDYTTFL